MKKMLLINGSPRKNGSSAELLKMISEKSDAKGYECELVNLCDLKISNCGGCLACKKTKECAVKDDMIPLYKKLQDADAISIAVPIYFAAETGLLKNFIDRLYALMDRKPDMTWDVRFGKKKKAVVAVCCGAPDGNMIYQGTMTRLVITLKSFGAEDAVSGIIPGASMKPVRDSPFTKELLDGVDFLLSS
jgi:multimeric flavodoxin WrbA